MSGSVQHCSRINVAIRQLLTARQTSFAVRLSYRIASAEFIIIPPPIGSAEYCVEHVCVCVCVCLSVRDHISRTTSPTFTNFLCMLPMAVARSSSGGVVIRYASEVTTLWRYTNLFVIIIIIIIF